MPTLDGFILLESNDHTLLESSSALLQEAITAGITPASVNCLATVTGSLVETAVLAATANGVATVSGAIVEDAVLTATANGAATVSASLVETAILAATVNGVATVSGTVTTTAGAGKPLDLGQVYFPFFSS